MQRLNIKPNLDYVKTPQAILKIVQIVTLLIAFSCITNCCDGGKPYVYASSYRFTIVPYWMLIIKGTNPQGTTVTESDIVNYNRNASFFQAVTVYGWLLVVFFFAFFFLRLHERFKQINWELVVMIISIVFSVLLLLCCSLMGSLSSTAYTIRPTGSSASFVSGADGSIFNLKTYVDTMVTGVVFGFFAWIAFIVEAALLFWKFWSKKKSGGHSSTNDPTTLTVSEATPGPSTLTTQGQTQSQGPPTQKVEAPPKYEAVTNLPGQMPNAAGQPVQYMGQPGANPVAGQGVVMYPGQYQAVPLGQPVQQWQMTS